MLTKAVQECGCARHQIDRDTFQVLTRPSPALRSAIESWAKQQKDNPSRSDAIRRLIEIALAAKPRESTHDK